MDKTPATWDESLDRGTQASEDFMTNVEDLPQKERDEVMPSPQPGTWTEYLANREPISDEFVAIVEAMEDPPPEEKHF